jgi:archaellum biogenesis protein FlaJ (TadC family)
MQNEGTLKNTVGNYIDDKVDLVKLKTADKAGSAVSGVIVGLVVARLSLFIIIFLSFSAAFAISEATGKYYLGFLLVAAFYILLAAVLIIFREKLVTMPVINAILKKLKFRENTAEH